MLPSSFKTSPIALTTARETTVVPSPSFIWYALNPPFIQPFSPAILPTVAPVPTPTEPSLTSSDAMAAAVIYDLGVVSASVRPGEADGYSAAAMASDEVREGSVGVGTGATVGKIAGEKGWMKGGFGAYQMKLGDGTTVVSLAVVNAIGDVLNEDGSILAGARSEDQSFLNTRSYLLGLKESPRFERAMEHTTLCVLVTDAELTKTECRQVALVAHDGMARAVSPVHTPMDGDTVFVLSAGDRSSNVFQLGAAAVDSTAASIRRAVRTADSVGGVPGLASIQSPTQSP